MTDYTQRLATALADRYRIERQLGQGGMAVVYLAHDLKNRRPVALKLLRPELMAAIGAERFLNEIQVTANLHHPHILQLHDSGEVDGLVYYVMPYVEGESLRSRLVRERQLGIEEAIGIATAVAGALDYAHRHGVIHRDIKPENVLLQEGQPVVADFGIALAVSVAGGGRLTETGLSLGTPQYMSPEQAAGDRTIDARSDVYSLAVMVYEMLAGEPPHTGATAQAIVAKVITEKATPISVHRDTVPAHVSAAIHKALAKLPADRFRSVSDFADALTRPGWWPLTAVTPAIGAPSFWSDRRAVALTGVAVLAMGAALWGWLGAGGATPPQVSRFTFTVPKGQEVLDWELPDVALSPDGSRLLYASAGDSGPRRLWLRPIDQLRATPLAGTEGAILPSFSPDGQTILFAANNALKVVGVNGGPPIALHSTGAIGAAWGADGWIYFTPGGRRLRRIAASGGAEDSIGTQANLRTVLRVTSVLPNGRGVLVTFWGPGTIRPPALADAEIGVMVVPTGELRPLAHGVDARFVAPGYLVYAGAEGTLHGAPFDPDRLALTGPPVPLLDGVLMNTGSAEFTLADNGTLVYLTGPAAAGQLVWVSAGGRETPIDPAVHRDFASPALSPDGRRLVFSSRSGDVTANVDLWVYDLSSRTLSRLTFEGRSNLRPTWTPDGRGITFVSDRSGRRALYTAPWDGSGPAESLRVATGFVQDAEWSRDGRALVYREGSGVAATRRDIYYFRPGLDSAPHPLLTTEFDEHSPTLSPDGRWMAYVSDETGRAEVYARPFPGPGGRWQISTDGGTEPLWSPDGSGVYFRTRTDLMRVTVRTVPSFATGARRRLFSTAGYVRDQVSRQYDIGSDGRFLFIKEDAAPLEMVVVLNWFEELKRRVAAGNQ